jgi:hypothetical protein
VPWYPAVPYLVPFSVASYSRWAFATEQRRLCSQTGTGEGYGEALQANDSVGPVGAGTSAPCEGGLPRA